MSHNTNMAPVAGELPECKIRFLHVFPGFNVGGAELRIARIINSMGPGIGHAILSINGNHNAAEYLDSQIKVPVFRAPPKNGALRFPFAIWKQIRAINPAVVLTYNWGATDALIGAKIARFRPVIHNECGLSADIDGKGWRRRLVRRFLLPGCFRVVVSAHTYYEKVIRDYGVTPDKIAFIKTGVDTNRFSPGIHQALRSKIAASESEAVVFGYIGTLRPSKNLPMLFRAFATVDSAPAQLAIFGDGPERKRLQSLANELGIEDRVYFHGYIDKPEHAFRAIDVNVTASRSEAASNSLMEAMATGLPVVSTDIADNRRILSEENRSFVYSHEDLGGYTSGLQAMASDSDLRRKLGQINRHRVCEEYPIDRMYREFSELWENAAAEVPEQRIR